MDELTDKQETLVPPNCCDEADALSTVTEEGEHRVCFECSPSLKSLNSPNIFSLSIIFFVFILVCITYLIN